MRTLKSTIFCLFLLVLLSNVQALDCLNPSKVPIPWWAKLKLPQALKRSAHLYYDSISDTQGSRRFELIEQKVDDTVTALYYTLNQLNNLKKSKSNVQIFAFNDEFPSGKTRSDNAHAKGVIAFDTKQKKGFYIMHSVPKYPDITDDGVNITLPTSGQIYGQNFMCISIDSAAFQKLMESYEITRPSAYYDNALLKPAYSKANMSTHSFTPRMSAQTITILNKSPKFEEYFYTDVVANMYRVHLAVESWCRPSEPSQCNNDHYCVNVNTIKYDDKIKWTISQDHSKWAVSFGSDRKIACFADINRAVSQKKRGGSALCFDNNSNLYHALHDLIDDHDDCDDSTNFLSLATN
eukprot:CAMPEP_0176459726 /NCGR_PEP_ID=MMETSP0127-20121128/33479_1 /TAXON_ID=938130 /ORGANISM="Platyophrya macrostoma, Strain WH" /LENGTH=350 /DNA_ID=CAMNT_0017850779 /DNA_START=52 /DNA_END=1104 /DNA_ORIENTATION=+